MKYVIVIPAKNEESDIAKTLKSVAEQSIPPQKCIVVDDSSSDNTAAIIKQFEEKYSFISYQFNTSKKDYQLGGHVVQVFEYGLEILNKENIDYDYAVKLDADITFDPDFMQEIANRLTNRKYGIVSGTPYYMEDSKKISEISPFWHTHGQFKIYNRIFLEQIKFIPRSLGWDSADNIQAMSLNWETEAFRDVHYKMSRKIGGKSSLAKGRINHGIGAYLLGYGYFYMLLKILHDMFKPPVLIGSFYLLKGFIKTHGKKRILDKAQIMLLRKQLWKSFFERFKGGQFILFQKIKK